ncbi:hypothetical protein [Desulfothermobacter acidiphilus]|uniref:hypothetical protein n=1 Tax=Desulfothermobacter acidiphilus TaxID=1938353 RepID=UPI003F8C8082
MLLDRWEKLYAAGAAGLIDAPLAAGAGGLVAFIAGAYSLYCFGTGFYQGWEEYGVNPAG